MLNERVGCRKRGPIPPDTRRRIEATVLQVFEEMAFAYGERAGRIDLRPLTGAHYQANVVIDGGSGGAVWLTVPARMAAELTGDILGADIREGISRDVVADAVGEILNIIAARLVTLIGGAEISGEIGPPQSRYVEIPSGDASLDSTDCYAFSIEERPILFGFRLE